MSIITIASGPSCWRGLDYYKNKKIRNIRKINNSEYTSIASGTEDYNVYLNLEHPRKSTCNCHLANGKRIICKHIVATYFNVVPNSAKDFEEEQEKLQQEYEEYEEKIYQNALNLLQSMSKKDLIEELIYIFDYAPDWVYGDFISRYDIEN